MKQKLHNHISDRLQNSIRTFDKLLLLLNTKVTSIGILIAFTVSLILVIYSLSSNQCFMQNSFHLKEEAPIQ